MLGKEGGTKACAKYRQCLPGKARQVGRAGRLAQCVRGQGREGAGIGGWG